MKEKKNSVFIATSLDGYIADKDGGIDWLHAIPNPENNDMGYRRFMSGIDAIVMGRRTYETVLGFDMDWPYSKPVFVLTKTLKEVPVHLSGQVELMNGPIKSVLDDIHERKLYQLYIDGGATIRSFLDKDLIDDMIITIIPLLLGDGIPLFSSLAMPLPFRCVASELYLNAIVQNQFVRSRDFKGRP